MSAKGQIHSQWRGGVSVSVLSQQYGRSQSAVLRVINEVRAWRILEQKLEYIFDESFQARDAAMTILAPMPEALRATHRAKPPAGLPPYLASLYAVPLLSREQEAHLFRKMNYLKFRIDQLRETIEPARARVSVLDEIERLQAEVVAAKNRIICANLRLVVSIARKQTGRPNDFFDLVSDGNMSLLQAVEKFDFARGFKFSTYASWAIIKNFARSIPKEKTRNDRLLTGQERVFETAADHRMDLRDSESIYLRNQETVHGMLDRLDNRERQILVSRYGLNGADEVTLERLGRQLGITKERVRQIESRAQEKLRKFAQDAIVE